MAGYMGMSKAMLTHMGFRLTLRPGSATTQDVTDAVDDTCGYLENPGRTRAEIVTAKNDLAKLLVVSNTGIVARLRALRILQRTILPFVIYHILNLVSEPIVRRVAVFCARIHSEWVVGKDSKMAAGEYFLAFYNSSTTRACGHLRALKGPVMIIADARRSERHAYSLTNY